MPAGSEERDDDSTGDDECGDDEVDDRDEHDDVLLTLPDELRASLKEPLGPIETEPERLLEGVDGALIAVGDVVTYHCLRAGRRPDVAVIDGLTERRAVDDAVAEVVGPDVEADDPEDGRVIRVENPAATITTELVEAIAVAIDADEPTTVVVDGEEDLATLPAVVLAPHGASVVYGQPGEGMVHVRVDEGVQETVSEVIEAMDGDHERFWPLVDANAAS